VGFSHDGSAAGDVSVGLDGSLDGAVDGSSPPGDGSVIRGDSGILSGSCAVTHEITLVSWQGDIVVMGASLTSREDGWGVSYTRREMLATEYGYSQHLSRLSPELAEIGPPIELHAFTFLNAATFTSAISSKGQSDVVVFDGYDGPDAQLWMAYVDGVGSVTLGTLLDPNFVGKFDVATNAGGYLITKDTTTGLAGFPVTLDGALGTGPVGATSGVTHHLAPRPGGYASVHASVREVIRLATLDDTGAQVEATMDVGMTVRSRGAFDATARYGEVMIAGVIDTSLRLIRIDGTTLETLSSNSLTMSDSASWVRVAAAGAQYAVLTYNSTTGLAVRVVSANDDAIIGVVPISTTSTTGVIAANASGQIAVARMDGSSPRSLLVTLIECS
jgi:hypothetical protein